ncbi:PAK-box/P21-Rho-binding [Penicillium griseofulvum]|uniref:PAK-box/P21-Rho-binding n=1 Tax=Penicillium patulum TaxID=5078 RepID=A0A135LTT5_PENPA|nr:PAK-box/P21-Rho-binding [Penicillium griseofulvum]KXG52393.1 PAK-box/P21-Rho-binding [Penicillium griseofulvum]
MSTFATMAKAWDNDDSDRPSTNSSNEYPEHAAHIRSRSTAHAHSPKRLSVFGGRSRSNTTTSTSSRRSPGSSMTSTDSSIASDERAVSSLGLRSDKQDKPSRSFLARGSRILRRQGSKINIVATLDEEDEADREKARPEREMFGRRARHADHSERLKSIISDPFDFHHLTHTNPSQFQSLDQTRENDLVTEFSAIRASQRPQTDLKGIRAEDIHFRNFSSDDLNSLGTATTVDVPSVSPPASPKPHRHHARRESRANENFSRPVSRYPRSCPTTPPPPTVPENPAPETGEPAPRAIDEILGLSTAMTYPECLQSAQPTRFFSPEPTDDGPRASSMSSHYDLEDVPEEEEGTRYWDSSQSSVGPHSRSTSQTSPPRNTQSPRPSTSERKAPLSIYVAEELSRKFSEALGSPTLPQHLQDTPRAQVEVTPPEPIANLNRFSQEDELYDSWDADIDYCYEHAAESTSNFDWSRTSLEETRPQVGVACSEGPWLSPRTRQLQPSPLSTSALPTPDLAPSPVQSMPSHSAATPSTTDFDQEFIARGADYFHPVSSTILPMGKPLSHEPLYEEYMTTDGESDRHFPFSQGMMGPISPRSSFSPISKCNSQESLMLSRAASIVRKHRSSVSTTTSVPELIYSLSSSRELMPTDRMTAGEALTRPASSSHHRQTKSLAEAHLRQNGSSTSLEGTDIPVSLHDRAKSTSEVESQPIKFEAPLPPVPPRNPRRKARSPSYSLFPTTAH